MLPNPPYRIHALALPLAALAMCMPATPQTGGQHWWFDSYYAERGYASDAETHALVPNPGGEYSPEAMGGGLIFNGSQDALVVAETLEEWQGTLPTEALTLSTWVAVERGKPWGGLISCVQDNGDAERGMVLGYSEEVFTFALASSGADDGDGKLTYLKGVTPIPLGKWCHVAATFDGKVMRLYLNGKLEAQSSEQHGRIDLDPTAPFVIGAYRDVNEDHPLDGRMLSAQIEPRAWTAEEVHTGFKKNSALIHLDPWTDLKFGFLVDPYLTWPTQTEMSVLFETTFPSTARVEYWKDTEQAEQASKLESKAKVALHECRLQGLEPDQKYFYRVSTQTGTGEAATSEVLSFRTASSPGKAFTFVVIGDTQTNGAVAKRVSDLAWMHRPNLVVHAGDLVDAGTKKSDWTDVFFPSMQPLLGRVPIMPVLGNHEQDAPHYYQYMSLPEPERWYSFRYADAEFFMIDGNRSLVDQSAQLTWLESALKGSTAKWRFAVLHQPPYTSDADDYGDTTQGPSLRGDPNVRNIVGLLEKYGVDICFSGHVHDYERTFPIRENQVLEYEKGGVIYVTAAGGGGPLENFDPTNTWFGHKKARYHHLVYVGIHGNKLEFQAIDENGRLFDALELTKRK